MSLHGTGVVAIWHDLLPAAKGEFYEWHNREHMPERLGISGFNRGRRYIAVRGAPEYFNLYEADSPDVLRGPDYLQRLNTPTAWTRQVVTSFRAVARGICRVLYSGGVGQGGVMLTLRFGVGHDAQETVARLLSETLLPVAVGLRGVAGAHLCRADVEGSRIETAERRARAGETVIPDWIVMIEGNDADAVEGAAQPACAALAALPDVHGLDRAVYTLQHQRGRKPWGDS
ncbi:MAG: hypothetical protein V4792_05790 [Pseudomonadota bacterium]